MRFASLCAIALMVVLSGCSTDREYKITHDQMIDAAVAAICEEGNVTPDAVKRAEISEKGGRLTTLTAPYKHESRIECKVDTREKHTAVPNLEIRVVTGKDFYTRHKEWEWRVHEVVEQKLKARSHGAESKPSSLPQQKPVLPPEVEPKKVDIKVN